ncbi:BTAD domain-containing putative transcriptional regulator [Streptomyces sp. NPDC088923]|uniref:AfsR/SARP family transcriptional regulator n=1 Tax=Streptomyces sp. NPDC088923 TaxID=3365913 RepID=UPI00381D3FF2
MDIQVLGSVSVRYGSRPHTVGSKRLTAILALLALSPGRAVSADQLEDELWAGRPLANARNALQASVGRLRRHLCAITGRPGDELIRTTASGYQLDVPAHLVDAQRFREQAAGGSALVARDPALAALALEDALALWRGPALMDVHDGLRLRIAAADLEERRITAYEDLITARLAVDPRGISLPELRAIAAEHPERERLSELLMLALYHAGRQSEALDVFHRARRRLAEEMGLEPGRALHRAYQAILEQDDALGEPRRVLAAL